MTTDELVSEFVKALTEAEGEFETGTLAFANFHPKVVHSTEDVTVWSIALNDETRDVRFVKVDGGSGYIGEAVPELVMHTEYRERS